MAATSLQKLSKIGSGTYGVVYQAHRENEPNVPVAIKRNIIDRDTNFIGSIKELDVLYRLRGHPYIVDLIAVSFGDPFHDPTVPKPRHALMSPLRQREYKDDLVHFVMEYAKYGDGHKYIRSGTTSIDQLKRGLVQILLALEYTHGKGIIHRDIKPQNLLIFSGPEGPIFKLTDFGLSKPYTSQGRQTPRMVTSWYRAPEICLEWPNYSPKSDLWSLGCVFFEMITGKPLLRSDDVDELILNKIFSVLQEAPSTELITKMCRYRAVNLNPEARSVRRKSWRERLGLSLDRQAKFNASPGSYDEFIDLLSHLLVVDPDQRWTATQALDHPFFLGYRDLIETVRRDYPPAYVERPILQVIDCPERKWASEVAFIIFNTRSTITWYKHRIMFQALDLYDRYLTWAEANVTPNSTPALSSSPVTVDSATVGRFHTRYEAELRFMVCLYISIKYFTTMYIPMSYLALAHDFYKTPQALAEAERFETELITTILQFSIYRETLYEVADSYGHTLNEPQIRELLMIQGMLTSYHGLTVKDLYTFYLIATGREKPEILDSVLPSILEKTSRSDLNPSILNESTSTVTVTIPSTDTIPSNDQKIPITQTITHEQ
jgi:serine/threonine protein kinase